LITSGWESVISYDPATGKELWRCDGVKGWAIPSAVANQEMVFVAAGYPTKRTIGIKLGGSGDLNGTPQVVWSYNKGTAYVASPILYGDYLYLIDDKGILTCVDPKTGEIKYEGGRVPKPEGFSASPVAFEDKLLLVGEDGDAFFIKPGLNTKCSRSIRWMKWCWLRPRLLMAKSLFAAIRIFTVLASEIEIR
jgi:outer membrane protein assembly factor BamB